MKAIDEMRRLRDWMVQSDHEDSLVLEDVFERVDARIAELEAAPPGPLRAAVEVFLERMEQRHAQVTGVEFPSLSRECEMLRAAMGGTNG